MNINVRFPDIRAKNESGQIEEIKSYLWQLAEEINFGQGSSGTAPAVKVTVAEAKKAIGQRDAIANFDAIKGLIIKSGDIVKAHYEKMDVLYLQGEYLAQSDFGTYAEATEARIEATEGSIISTVSRLEALSSDYGDYKRTSSTAITQNADAITLEAERATDAEGELSSSIEETAESITAEVTRAKGAEGTLSTRITQNTGSITAEVTRATAAEGTLSSRITADAGKISLVVDGSNAIKAGAITAAINDQTGSSKVLLSANAIDIDGITAFVRPGELSTLGSTVINGGNVTTGNIKSANYYYSSGDFSHLGTMISLADGTIRSKNFAVTSSGDIKARNAYVSGTIDASSGSVGNLEIEEDGSLYFYGESGETFAVGLSQTLVRFSKTNGTWVQNVDLDAEKVKGSSVGSSAGWNGEATWEDIVNICGNQAKNDKEIARLEARVALLEEKTGRTEHG